MEERRKLIEDLKALYLNYEFEKFTTAQLKKIRDERREARFRLCNKINDLASELGLFNRGYELYNLYSYGGTMDDLKKLYNGLELLAQKRLVRSEVIELAEYLDIPYEDIVRTTINRPAKTKEDYEEIRTILYKKLHEIEEEKPESTRNYGLEISLYTFFDDPIFSEVDYEITISKDKLREIIYNLDKIRRRKKNKSIEMNLLSKKEYDKITKPFRNLEENYDKLDSYDFERLISFYNRVVSSIDEEELEETNYRHTI